MAGPSAFGNLARVAKVLALLLFLLPWVTVSCSPQGFSEAMGNEASGSPSPPPEMMSGAGSIPIATASGLQLAMGAPKMAPSSLPQSGSPNSREPEFSPEIGVIVGGALILLALLATFLLKGATGAIAGIGGSALALGALIWSVFIYFPDAARAALLASGGNPGGGPQPNIEQMAQIIQVKPEIGFYLVLIMLVAAIAFNVLAMRKPSAAAAAAPAAPPSDPPA